MAAHARHDAPGELAGGPLERSVAEERARTLRAVADPTRLQLLSMIAGSPAGEATIGDLAAALGLSQPTVTHHVRIMSDDGLLERESRGKYVWLSIAADRRDGILDLLR
jgi:ArsR family transcriptional regulator